MSIIETKRWISLLCFKLSITYLSHKMIPHFDLFIYPNTWVQSPKFLTRLCNMYTHRVPTPLAIQPRHWILSPSSNCHTYPSYKIVSLRNIHSASTLGTTFQVSQCQTYPSVSEKKNLGPKLYSGFQILQLSQSFVLNTGFHLQV